jgi:transposase
MEMYYVVIVGAEPIGLATAIGLGTMVGWVDEIVGYFDRRTTNITVEEINNKLKLIKRLGYGFCNFSIFRLRSVLNLHFTINSPLN